MYNRNNTTGDRRMNGKERILCAINHEIPDRIPIALGYTNCTTISLRAYRNLVKKLGITGASENLMMKNFQIVAVDDKVLERVDIDTRSIYGLPPVRNTDVFIDDKTFISEW